MLTPSLEDYLEELFRLEGRTCSTRPKDLADELNVSMPSVTKALQRLRSEGFITYEAYGGVALTPLGKEIGGYLVKRNKALQNFVGSLGIPCDIADEVESMEHYISPEVVSGVECLNAFLQDPAVISSFGRFKENWKRQSSPLVKVYCGTKRLRRFGGKSIV